MEIISAFQHIFFIVCAPQNLGSQKKSTGFPWFVQVYLDHRFQIADTEQNSICLRLIGNRINMSPVNQILVFAFNNILSFSSFTAPVCRSISSTLSSQWLCVELMLEDFRLAQTLQLPHDDFPGKIIHVVALP